MRAGDTWPHGHTPPRESGSPEERASAVLEGVGCPAAGVTAPAPEQSHSPGAGGSDSRPSWAPHSAAGSACRGPVGFHCKCRLAATM